MTPPDTYSPPPLMHNGHDQTIFPTLFRKINTRVYSRERIATADDDFLDLDWSTVGRRRLAIISHGLEGDSRRPYVKGMVRALNRSGWDCLAWNFRGCSGEINRRLKFYHSGSYDDLDTVISHAAARGRYNEIALVGFSIGGNITLLYLGKHRDKVHPLVSCAAALSVPCDLASSAGVLARPANRIYMQHFLRLLHGKIKAKMAVMPQRLDDAGYAELKNFADFDDRYTAPLNGFRDAADYWQQCSSKPWLTKIAIPTLMISARNDPFLAPECFPEREAAANANLFLETPAYGGHVGFVKFSRDGLYWSERRIAAFFDRRSRMDRPAGCRPAK